MASAASTVLGVVELLEQVLLNSRCVDVWQFQRVSKFWYSTIAGSPALQAALFKPKAQGSDTWLKESSPLQRPNHDIQLTAQQVLAAIDGIPQKVVMNPLIHHVCACLSGSPEDTLVYTTSLYEIVPNGCSLEPPAILSAMLLTQPGAKCVVVQRDHLYVPTMSGRCQVSYGKWGSRRQDMTVGQDEQGNHITVGRLFRSLEDEWRRLEQTGSRIERIWFRILTVSG